MNEDNEFYRKISPVFKGQKCLIPFPKLSPEERERRRLSFRNERKLYKIKSAFSGQGMISVFRPDTKFVVFTRDEWWSDLWDPMEFGRDFDFDRSFFKQFYELQLCVPRPPLINNKAFNSEYCNFADGNKDCYLATSVNRCEDCFYSFLMVTCKDSSDCVWCVDSELLYECVDCRNCYNLNYSQNCGNCHDCTFLYDCRGCANCAFCVNLRSKNFCIFNKQYSKDEYFRILDELELNPYKFLEFQKQFPVRANNFVSCENVSGDNIFNCKNVHFAFDVYDSEDCAYLHDGLSAKDCYDVCFFDGAELCYESTSLIGYGYRFTMFCRDSYDLFYCDNCHSCKNLFACCGLRDKEYCVFNKQYSKDEYEGLVLRIIAKMTQTGEWGEFFPVEYNLFPYEDSLASDYF